MERIKIGDSFHHWTVIAGPLTKRNRLKYWTCECTCGVIKDISQYNLLNDKSRSCGCAKVVSEETRKLLSELGKGHPGYWTGKQRSEETKRKISESKKKTHQQTQGAAQ